MRSERRVRRRLILLGLLLASCGSHTEEIATPGEDASMAVTGVARTAKAEASTERAPSKDEGACPSDMRLVDTSYCPDVKRKCVHSEYSTSNKITICHAFEHAPATCQVPERHERFCIDTFEYPNQEGARAPVMIDFYDAMALCSEKGKRLCWEGEWNAACEGPEKTPFPYGYERDPEKCNIESPWIFPSLTKMYSTDPRVSEPELVRLDEGVPSGSKAGCKSGFGVHDQTGNVDEWVMLEKKRGKGGWAGLKGGAWGHVRNACRPVTTSHAAEFTYYFISTRCCADAKPDATPGAALWVPPPLPAQKKTATRLSRGFTPPLR